MTTVQAAKIARRKLSLLELAQELGNVSKACRIAGYSRQQFYEIRRNFQMYGAEGLLDRMPSPLSVGFHYDGITANRKPLVRRQTNQLHNLVRRQ